MTLGEKSIYADVNPRVFGVDIPSLPYVYDVSCMLFSVVS